MADLEQQPSPPGERYYCLVFGSQINRLSFRYTHTWATVVRVTHDDPASIVHDTISWLPATGNIRPWHYRTEPGLNGDLHSALQTTHSQGQRIAVWRPFEIRPGFYRKFLLQKEFMESDQVGYQANDTLGEAGWTGNGCNCIHAITDNDAQFGRAGYPMFRVGFPASKHVVRRLQEREAVIDAGASHEWLYHALGLTEFPLERRELPAPNNLSKFLNDQIFNREK